MARQKTIWKEECKKWLIDGYYLAAVTGNYCSLINMWSNEHIITHYFGSVDYICDEPLEWVKGAAKGRGLVPPLAQPKNPPPASVLDTIPEIAKGMNRSHIFYPDPNLFSLIKHIPFRKTSKTNYRLM